MRAVCKVIWLGLRLEWYRSIALRWLVSIALGIFLTYQGYSSQALLCLSCALILIAMGMLCMSRGIEGGCYLGGTRMFRLGQAILLMAFAMLYAQWRMGDNFSLSRAVVYMTCQGDGDEGTTLAGRVHHRLDTTDISPEVRRLMGAIALGYLPREDTKQERERVMLKQEFLRSGAAHILVVSGFHLGVVVGVGAVALSVLRRIKRGRGIYFVSLLGMVWGFVVLTGGAPPTIRAAIIISLVLLGQWRFWPIYVPNLLAVAALLQILIEPRLLCHVGMWLSYMAVLSIAVYTDPITRCIGAFRWRTLRYLWQAWVVGLAVQVYVLPLCLYAFGAVSWSFVWTGVPLMLLSSLLIPVSLLIYALGWLGLTLPLLNTLAEYLGQWILAVVRFGSHLSPLWQQADLPLWGLIGLWTIASVYPLYKSGTKHLDHVRY